MLISHKKTVTALRKDQNDTGKNNKRQHWKVDFGQNDWGKVNWSKKQTKFNLTKNVLEEKNMYYEINKTHSEIFGS